MATKIINKGFHCNSLSKDTETALETIGAAIVTALGTILIKWLDKKFPNH